MVSSAEVVHASTTDAAPDGAMAEIPFVPAPLRQTAKAEVVDDTIVVVGQRQKKRKRTKKAELSETPSTPTENTKAEPEGVVPFDFASAPNILDDVPSEPEDGGSGKRRRSKRRSGGFSYFDSFSGCSRDSVFCSRIFFVDDIGTALERREGVLATPRDRRGLRSGNVSQTFRS